MDFFQKVNKQIDSIKREISLCKAHGDEAGTKYWERELRESKEYLKKIRKQNY